jgi:hypothetical protein
MIGICWAKLNQKAWKINSFFLKFRPRLKMKPAKGRPIEHRVKKSFPAGGNSGFLRWGLTETDVQRHNPEVKGHA